MKFKKKPVIIDAIQFKGTCESRDEIIGAFGFLGSASHLNGECYYLSIKTLEGMMRANPGDWIIKGIAGEIYPCKPEIFEKTYERAE